MADRKRPDGTGTMEPHYGAWRVRVRVQRRRRTLGTYATRELAESALRGWLALRASASEVRLGGQTLRDYGAAWLDRREARGGRAIADDRRRWAKHVLAARFVDLPLESLSRRHVSAWVDQLLATRADDKRGRRSLSWQTVKHCLNLVRACIRAAVDDELLERNPAAGVVVHRRASADPGWTYLTPAEQTALLTCAAIPRSDRLVIAFALGTGLRQGEQWALELRDLHLDDADPFVWVRWGSPGLPPKSGKPRRVPLTGFALAAAREWVTGLGRYLTSTSGKRVYANEHGLVFPTSRGCRRGKKPIRRWETHLAAAKLGPEGRHDGRGVRWHDLRHACASSLVAGWWGRVWRLDEVRSVLGHTSVTVTERYAHLAPSVLAAAAAETRGPDLAPKPPPPIVETACFEGRATEDSNLWPTAPEAAGEALLTLDLDALRGQLGATEDTARGYLAAVAARSPHVHRHGVESAEAALRLAATVRALLERRRRRGAA